MHVDTSIDENADIPSAYVYQEGRREKKKSVAHLSTRCLLLPMYLVGIPVLQPMSSLSTSHIPDWLDVMLKQHIWLVANLPSTDYCVALNLTNIAVAVSGIELTLQY